MFYNAAFKDHAGDLEGAKAIYQRILKTNAKHADSIVGLANIANKQGKSGDFEVYKKRLTELNFDDDQLSLLITK
jgi:hypothetical protein